MDTNKIKELIEIFENSQVSTMELEADDIKLKLTKEQAASAKVMSNKVDIENDKQENTLTESQEKQIKAPLVGTYYESFAPGSKPFITEGQEVHKGDIVCIIEAMKVMNEIHSPYDGTVKKICLNNGELVEFDQTLILIGE